MGPAGPPPPAQPTPPSVTHLLAAEAPTWAWPPRGPLPPRTLVPSEVFPLVCLETSPGVTAPLFLCSDPLPRFSEAGPCGKGGPAGWASCPLRSHGPRRRAPERMASREGVGGSRDRRWQLRGVWGQGPRNPHSSMPSVPNASQARGRADPQEGLGQHVGEMRVWRNFSQHRCPVPRP